MFLELFNDFLIVGKVLVLLDHVIKVLDIRVYTIIKDLGFLLYTLLVILLTLYFLSPLILLCNNFSFLLGLRLR